MERLVLGTELGEEIGLNCWKANNQPERYCRRQASCYKVIGGSRPCVPLHAKGPKGGTDVKDTAPP